MGNSGHGDLLSVAKHARSPRGVPSGHLIFCLWNSSFLFYFCLQGCVRTRDDRLSDGVLNLLYIFDNYTLDPDRRELRSGASVVAMEPQVFDLLLLLIRHRERVVSRDELISSIWAAASCPNRR